jgi:hypothetical protein
MRLSFKVTLLAVAAGSSHLLACKTRQATPGGGELMAADSADAAPGYQPMGSSVPRPFSYFCGNASSGECNGGGELLVSTTPQSENGKTYAAGEVILARYKHRGGGMKGRSELGVALPFKGNDTRFEYELVAKTSPNVGTFMQVQPMCGKWTPYLMVSAKKRQLSLAIFPSKKDEQHKVICTADMGNDNFMSSVRSYKFVGVLSNSNRGYWDLYIDGRLVKTSCGGEHSYTGDTVADDLCDASKDSKVTRDQEVQLKIGTYEGWHNPNPNEAWAAFYSFNAPSLSAADGGQAPGTGGGFTGQEGTDPAASDRGDWDQPGITPSPQSPNGAPQAELAPNGYPFCTNGSNNGDGWGWDEAVTDLNGSHSCVSR